MNDRREFLKQMAEGLAGIGVGALAVGSGLPAEAAPPERAAPESIVKTDYGDWIRREVRTSKGFTKEVTYIFKGTLKGKRLTDGSDLWV